MSEGRNNRYIIKYGKFGAYFYDIDRDEDLTLEQVCVIMNHGDIMDLKWDRMIKEGKIK